jgi:hypothetical protein
MTDLANDWDATKRAVTDLCQALWSDPGHPCSAELLTRIGEMRATIHRSAEITRQPWGAVVTVHEDLNRAASAWSERGSGLHRQAQAEVERLAAVVAAERVAAIEATQAAIPEPGFYWAKTDGNDRWVVVEVFERRADGRRFVLHHDSEGSHGAESVDEWGSKLEPPVAAVSG